MKLALFRTSPINQKTIVKSKDFLTLCDLDREEICSILNLTVDIKSNPERYAGALKGKGLAMIFEKPSLRTRVSFDVGIHQLGGFSICLLPSDISLGKRESVHDVAKNLERMVNGIMIRTFAHKIAVDLAASSAIPVINGLTDYSHPCQAMADFFTIRERKGKLPGLKLRSFSRDAEGNILCQAFHECAFRIDCCGQVMARQVEKGESYTLR